MTKKRQPVSEQKARALGREAGYKSMRRAKRLRWNIDDCVAALVAYRLAAGRPDATPEAARAALAGLDGRGPVS